MIGKGETDPSVILEKKRSGEINGCNRMKRRVEGKEKSTKRRKRYVRDEEE